MTTTAPRHTGRSTFTEAAEARRFRGDRDAPTTTIHPTLETARTLLEALGWTVETYADAPRPTTRYTRQGQAAANPEAFYRAIDPDGYGYWHLEDALSTALEVAAAALEDGADIQLRADAATERESARLEAAAGQEG